tara:strand:- start:753 stop:965 length:213 start_codon:yes stop_codon:yes gene_type:complete
VGKKKRRYFKTSGDGVSKSIRGYMVKWLDNESESFSHIKNAGPFSDVDEACELLHDNLRSGKCSWMVSYE